VTDSIHTGVKKYFPPKLEWLLAWSTLFRSEGTLGNYLGYVKTGCLLCKASVKVFDHQALGRAKASTAKRLNFTSRPKKFIQRTMLAKMMAWCEENPEYARYGVLYLVAYAFLLRLPSEALPIQWGKGGDNFACLTREGNMLTLTLRRRHVPLFLQGMHYLPPRILVLQRVACRKNRPEGGKITRGCWCKASEARRLGLHCLMCDDLSHDVCRRPALSIGWHQSWRIAWKARSSSSTSRQPKHWEFSG